MLCGMVPGLVVALCLLSVSVFGQEWVQIASEICVDAVDPDGAVFATGSDAGREGFGMRYTYLSGFVSCNIKALDTRGESHWGCAEKDNRMSIILEEDNGSTKPVHTYDDDGNARVLPGNAPGVLLWPNRNSKGCKNEYPWYTLEGQTAMSHHLVFEHSDDAVKLPSSIRALYGDARGSPDDNTGTVCFQVEVDVSRREREPEPEPDVGEAAYAAAVAAAAQAEEEARLTAEAEAIAAATNAEEEPEPVYYEEGSRGEL